MPRHPTMSVAAAIAALALLLAGCGDDDASDGGSDGGRPTIEEIVEVLSTDDLSDEQVDCLAESFMASDISDEGLRAIVDAGGVTTATLSSADQAAVQAAAGEAVTCAAEAGAPVMPPATG